jgi:hypothetical protein
MRSGVGPQRLNQPAAGGSPVVGGLPPSPTPGPASLANGPSTIQIGVAATYPIRHGQGASLAFLSARCIRRTCSTRLLKYLHIRRAT